MSFPRRAGKTCAHCGEWFRPKQRPQTARFCSRPCAEKGRPRASRVAAGRKAGHARSENLWARIDALPPRDAYRLGRKHQRADVGNRVQSARRAGFADGYEAACDACAALGWQTPARRSA